MNAASADITNSTGTLTNSSGIRILMNPKFTGVST